MEFGLWNGERVPAESLELLTTTTTTTASLPLLTSHARDRGLGATPPTDVFLEECAGGGGGGFDVEALSPIQA